MAKKMKVFDLTIERTFLVQRAISIAAPDKQTAINAVENGEVDDLLDDISDADDSFVEGNVNVYENVPITVNNDAEPDEADHVCDEEDQ